MLKTYFNRECCGDASENALLKFFEMFVCRVVEYRKTNPKVCEIPFTSSNKYQVNNFFSWTQGLR